MKIKKITTVFVMVLLLLNLSCKEKKAFVDPVYVFLKWSSAVKNLNYKEYSECEAFPKDELVFRELYSDFYFADLITRELGEYRDNDVRTDIESSKYNLRKVYFECRRIERKTGRAVQDMKGDIEFINYISGPKVNKGWLMYNRTIISTRINKTK